MADRRVDQAKEARDRYGKELLAALKGSLADKQAPEIAIDVLGVGGMKPKDVRANWHTDGDLRMIVRRRIEKAAYLVKVGYRKLARGR